MAKQAKALLTAKQEKFVCGLIEGLTQREAYKRSYSCSRMKDKTIDEEACKLLKTPKVSARYEELLSVHSKKALWTKEMAVEKMIWLAKKAEESIQETGCRQGNATALVNAVKELNALEGTYHSDRLKEAELKLKELEAKESDKPLQISIVSKTE